MIRDSLIICQCIQEDNTALNLAFSIGKTVHMALAHLLLHIVNLFLPAGSLTHLLHVMRLTRLHGRLDRFKRCICNRPQLFQRQIREINIHILNPFLGKLC